VKNQLPDTLAAWQRTNRPESTGINRRERREWARFFNNNKQE
jgi:hypothetical protein